MNVMKVLILDTSILNVWLDVPGMSPVGPKDDKWDQKRVSEKISSEMENGTLFVLPLAAIIETGNHITHASGNIFPFVNKFADFLIQTAEGRSPWAAFTSQNSLWTGEGLRSLAERWRKTAMSGQSIGDASIVDVAEYYSQAGNEVEILTADQGLKAYQPISPAMVPRRRK